MFETYRSMPFTAEVNLLNKYSFPFESNSGFIGVNTTLLKGPILSICEFLKVPFELLEHCYF